MRRSRAFSSAIAAWEASEPAASRCSWSNDGPAIVECPERRAAGGEIEREFLSGRIRVAGLDDRAVVCEQACPVCSGRLDSGLDDHAQLLVDVVRRGERLAEARDRVAQPAALGFELGEPLLELVRHVVERVPEHRELVAAANRDALREPAARDPVRRLGESPQRPHDRAALEVRDERDERRAKRSGRAAACCASSSWQRRSSDCGLSTANRTTGIVGDGGSDERPEAVAADRDRLHLADGRGTRPATAGEDATIRPRRRITSESAGASPLRRRSWLTSLSSKGTATVTYPTSPLLESTVAWRVAAKIGGWPTMSPSTELTQTFGLLWSICSRLERSCASRSRWKARSRAIAVACAWAAFDPVLVGREERPHPGLDPRVDPARLALPRDLGEAPEGCPDRKQGEQQEIDDELDLEATHDSVPHPPTIFKCRALSADTSFE